MNHPAPTHSTVPVFGERIPGQQYIFRPGAYVVIFGPGKRIATVRAEMGHFLPGGGIFHGEATDETVRRETLEETGLELTALRNTGLTAYDFFHAARSGRYYQIHSTFFVANLLRQTAFPVEAGHILEWMSPQAAAAALHRPSQAWVVGKLCLPLRSER